ncbi:hypothetical protein EMM73_02370 [Rheinheimera sediminis]|uniref:hypothetical protein n=1 Tax=Rheinheimera sp. YQF-1 TaxID=2499626 RepID=UPI000FDB3FC0|nr:hypothetical protein [Rheinheimera sp. YQF-1]RVT48158.1 hypothetical protein EMM73_02370 [Rheinheimera sp. YQF-1]
MRNGIKVALLSLGLFGGVQYDNSVNESGADVSFWSSIKVTLDSAHASDGGIEIIAIIGKPIKKPVVERWETPGPGGGSGGGGGGGGGSPVAPEDPSKETKEVCFAKANLAFRSCLNTVIGPGSHYQNAVAYVCPAFFDVEVGMKVIFGGITVRNYDSCMNIANSKRDGYVNGCEINRAMYELQCTKK